MGALTVRGTGAALTAGSAVYGIQALGKDQFGVSIIAISVGQIVALPSTSIERLVLRQASLGDLEGLDKSLHFVRRCNQFVAILGALFIGVLVTRGAYEMAAIAAACGLTAVSSGMTVSRQAVNRAKGSLTWGQIPNELVKPAALFASYLVADQIAPPQIRGSGAVIATGVVCLVVALCIPVPDRRLATRTEKPTEDRASIFSSAVSLIAISIIAAGIDRVYPLLLAALAGPARVAEFSVAMRLIQLGLFGQSLAIFLTSPALAVALGHDSLEQIKQAARSIRLAGVAIAIPVVAFLMAFNEHSILGLNATLLIATSLALVAGTVNGASQTILIMGKQEAYVARTYAIAYFTGLALFAATAESPTLAALLAVASTYAVWGALMSTTVRRTHGVWA